MSDIDAGREDFGTEVHTVTSEGVLKIVRGAYDPSSESIVHEIAKGVCSTCGRIIPENAVTQCYFSDLICGECRVPFFGRSVCRSHLETHIGSKQEAMVLLLIAFKQDRGNARQLSGLFDGTLLVTRNILINRGYVERKSFGIAGNSIKVTEVGLEVLGILIECYSRDYDFALFLQNLGVGTNGLETAPGQK